MSRWILTDARRVVRADLDAWLRRAESSRNEYARRLAVERVERLRLRLSEIDRELQTSGGDDAK